MYSGKCIFQQSAVCKTLKLFDPQAQLEVHSGDIKRSGILFTFFTIEKIIRTLIMVETIWFQEYIFMMFICEEGKIFKGWDIAT